MYLKNGVTKKKQIRERERERERQDNLSLHRRLLSSDCVQLDLSLTGWTFDQSAIASRQVSIEPEFVLGDPLA
jgi:hypothetical protein